jgi:hypothetical protein
MDMSRRALTSMSLLVAAAGCAQPRPQPTPQAPYGYAQQPYAGYGQPPAGYGPSTPPPGYAQQPPPAYGGAPPPGYGQGAPPAPPPQPPAPGQAPPPPPAAPNRPLLPPLVGSVMWQAEARAILQELESNLSPDKRQLVAGIPMVFDPNPGEINAFAGCDDSGAPFIAGTEGLLEAIDAIAQTKATDELFGTRTYDAYTSAVTPALVSRSNANALLPPNVIPPQYWADPRRISRAHEMFDEIVAFTFGHELSHHYLGHTGCAHGQPAGIPPAVTDLGRALSTAVNLFNQPNEIAADSAGCINVLDSGLARSGRAYRWNEEGGQWLLDFFARLDGASGANPLLGFLRTHPSPGLRIPILQGVAATWHFQHPG